MPKSTTKYKIPPNNAKSNVNLFFLKNKIKHKVMINKLSKIMYAKLKLLVGVI